MPRSLFLITVIYLVSCQQSYRWEKYTFKDGTTKFYQVRTVIDNDTLLLEKHKSGNTYLKIRRIKSYDSQNKEVFYYDDDGGIIDYKYYVDDGLKFYARYNESQQIVQINGDPIRWYEDPDYATPVEVNSPRIFKTLTFTPPYMILKSWIGRNE